MHAARFAVSHTLSLTSRGLFFVLGEIGEGEVRVGMVVEMEPGFGNAIHAVEIADDRIQRRAWVALGFRYRDAAELRRWQAIAWEGRMLRIPAEPVLHPCACCGFRTMRGPERGSFDLCPVCDWEDDSVQYADPGYRGGANPESLNEARTAFFAAHPQFAPRG